MLNVIDSLLNELSKSAPLEEDVAKNFRQEFILDYAYNSVCIDGSALTRDDVEKILFTEESLGGVSLKEHVDVFAELEGFMKVEQLLSQGETLSVFAIKDLYRKIVRGSQGDYREGRIVLYGAPNQFPPAQKVRNLIDEAIEEFNFTLSGVHFIHRLAYFHLNFEMVHPFESKNGTVGRLLVNLALMKAGYPPIVFLNEDRDKYYDAFATYFQSGGDGSMMCELLEGYVITSLKKYVDEPGRDKFVIIKR